MRSIASASSTAARRTPMSGVRVEPVGDPAHVLDAVLRLPAAREVVVVLGEPYENGLFAQHLQRGEQLLSLLDGTAEVSLRVKDEERRLHVRDVGQRRAEDELLAPLPWRGVAHLVLPEVPPNVARTERGDVVRDAPLRDRGPETISVADDPIGHEPAVAAAGHIEALWVDPAECEGMIDTGHEVVIVLPAPIADARLDEPLAVRMTSARVGEQHRIATPREHVELVEERVAVCRVRPAMDLQDEGPLLRWIEPARLHEPALDRPAIRAGELDALGCRDEP